jgi:hypothetical protein
MSLADFCNMLPAMAISYIPAMVHKSEIISSVIQAVSVYVVTLFATLEMSA